MNKRFNILLILFFAMGTMSFAQTAPDSVIIHVGEKSQVIFSVDKADIETFKQYDFQAVVDDLVGKLEQKDTNEISKSSEAFLKTVPTVTSSDEEDWDESWRNRDKDSDNDYKNDRGERTPEVRRVRRYNGRRTHHSFNFDLGLNNYIKPGNKFPDQDNDLYTLKPWGSWYFAMNSTQRTRLTRNFFLEWGMGVSWYNFKFENENLLVGRDENGVTFTPDTRDIVFRKSKLTETFINASIVPMLDFGDNHRKSAFFDSNHSQSFRIGVGPYAGYRVGSSSRIDYKDEGEKRKEKNQDNFYLNNIRYGLRLQVGFADTDLFFNYDLNGLFASGKGPELNAFSFGITF